MSRKVTNGLDLLNRPIDNVADPASAQQAATKNYVDGAIRGLDWKQEVMAASTGNVTLASPGTSLDGYTLVANDRVLLKDQTAPAENGIYVWTASGSALTRATDANTGPLLSGSTVTVQRGTVNADRVYRVNTDDPITLGTTGITVVQVGAASNSYIAGNGLSLTGSTFAVVPGTGILADGTSTRIDTSVVARKAAFACLAATSTACTHNFGTRDVHVTVYDTASFDEVLADVVHTDTNNVTVTFASAPSAGAYRIVVVG